MKYTITLLLCLFLSASQSIAQPVSTVAPRIFLASVPEVLVKGKTVVRETTISEILKSPRLLTNRRGYKITGFMVSLLPVKGDYIGPYAVKGAELTKELKGILKRFAGTSGKILFEKVTVAGPGATARFTQSLVLAYNN